jgi:DNA replication protein DnaC
MEKFNLSYVPKAMTQRVLRTAIEATKQCPECGNQLIPMKVRLSKNSNEFHYIPRKCECEEKREKQEQARRQRLVRQEYLARHTYTWLRGQPPDLDLQKRTFENFDKSRQEEAYEFAKTFAENPDGTLILHGSYGVGKTHLLAASCNELAKRMIGSLFTTSAKMFAEIQQRINKGEDYQDIINQAIQTSLFVLDDIDKAKPSPFRESVYFAIVDERVKAGKPITISTNKMDELADFVGGAVYSRLHVGLISVEMTGMDMRKGS